jgi:hypothetical protein
MTIRLRRLRRRLRRRRRLRHHHRRRRRRKCLRSCSRSSFIRKSLPTRQSKILLFIQSMHNVVAWLRRRSRVPRNVAGVLRHFVRRERFVLDRRFWIGDIVEILSPLAALALRTLLAARPSASSPPTARSRRRTRGAVGVCGDTRRTTRPTQAKAEASRHAPMPMPIKYGSSRGSSESLLSAPPCRRRRRGLSCRNRARHQSLLAAVNGGE